MNSEPSNAFAILLIFGIILFLYFIPSIVGRHKRNFWAIFALNLFLGITFIGWVIALVWALTKDAPQQNIDTL